MPKKNWKPKKINHPHLHNNTQPGTPYHVVWHKISPPIHAQHMHDDRGYALPYDTVPRTVTAQRVMSRPCLHTLYKNCAQHGLILKTKKCIIKIVHLFL